MFMRISVLVAGLVVALGGCAPRVEPVAQQRTMSVRFVPIAHVDDPPWAHLMVVGADQDVIRLVLRIERGKQSPTLTPAGEIQYSVVSGSLILEMDEQTHVLAPGDARTIDMGTAHKLQAGPDRDVLVLTTIHGEWELQPIDQ